MLNSIFPQERGIRTLVIFLVAYALVVLIFALAFDYQYAPAYPPEGYKVYFDKLNWFLYPLFFFLIGVIVRMTWAPFQQAWIRSGELQSSVIRTMEGNAVTAAEVAGIVRQLNKVRNLAIFVAIVLGFLWGVVDGAQTRAVYLSDNAESQYQLASVDPDFTVKWIFEELESSRDLPARAPWHQVAFYTMLELEQAFLIGLGFLVLIQVLLQVSVFACLDNLSVFGGRFRVQLIFDSPSRDFGLGDWNRAMDIFYWVISLGLVITLISKFTQPAGDPEIGQVMGQWALGALLALPFLVTVVGRVHLVRELDRFLEKNGSDEDWEARHNQNGWPLDPKRMQKIGFLICMALYAMYAGKDAADLVGNVLG